MDSLPLMVNGESVDVPTGSTVESLLGLLGLAERRLAVAINRDVVPRSAFPHQELSPGDRVEILEAVGGG